MTPKELGAEAYRNGRSTTVTPYRWGSEEAMSWRYGWDAEAEKASQPKPQIRYRLNVQYSVKGVQTTDATMEMSGNWPDIEMQGFLDLQREFQDRVNLYYPPPSITDDKGSKANNGA